MWSPSTETIHLYLNSLHVSARLVSRSWTATSIIELGQWPWDPTDEQSLRWRGATLPSRRRRWSVQLGSSLLKIGCVPIAPDLRRARERRQVAAEILSERYGLTHGEWNVQIDLSSPIRPHEVAVAMKTVLTRRLQALAKEQKGDVFSVRPFVLDALAEAPSTEPWFGDRAADQVCAMLIAEEDSMTAVVGSAEGGYESANALNGIVDETMVTDEYRRIRVGRGLPDAAMRGLVASTVVCDRSTNDVTAPYGSRQRPDFLDRLRLVP